MNQRQRSTLKLAALSIPAIVLTSGCATFFDRVADTVLANEVRFDDREVPRTAYPISASADLVQLVGGQGKGLSCSLPPLAQALAFNSEPGKAPVALQMRQACAFHDYCYRHGNATYVYSQADCDFTLQQQAFRLCKFINKTASISECETDARKVTLGVRLGGWGSFQSARAAKADKASTFLEFDPHPVRATSYRVLRIADAPRSWVRDGLLPKAAYHFEIRPSGSLVHILGWKSSGAMFCTSFTLPASFNALNGPPMVVRDAAAGEDWFVWWRRYELSATHGSFALLPPGRASEQDWAKAGGGFATHTPDGECESKSPWGNRTESPAAPLLAFVTANTDQQFSEIHPVTSTNTPGRVRLMGLSAHECSPGDPEVSPCVVDIEFDTVAKRFLQESASPNRYSLFEQNCGGAPDGKPRDDCDRYRNFVGAPVVVMHPTRPSLLWTRRGTGDGDGYEASATVRRYAIGKQAGDIASNLGELTLTGFPERMEPAFILNAATAAPTFLSIVPSDEGLQLLSHTAAPNGTAPPSARLECLSSNGKPWRPDSSWLRRPPAHVHDRQDPGRSEIVFSRVLFDAADGKVFMPAPRLELAVATLTNGACTGVHEAPFEVFAGFAAKEERDAAALALSKPIKPYIGAARDASDRYVERVRGGQMVLADITGDGVPDLVQVAKIPKSRVFRAVVLTGQRTPAGLRFSHFGVTDRASLAASASSAQNK